MGITASTPTLGDTVPKLIATTDISSHNLSRSQSPLRHRRPPFRPFSDHPAGNATRCLSTTAPPMDSTKNAALETWTAALLKFALLIRRFNNCVLVARMPPLVPTTCTKTSMVDTTTTNSADLSSFSSDTKGVMVALNQSADSASRLVNPKTFMAHSASAVLTAVILVLTRICLHSAYLLTLHLNCSLSISKSSPSFRGLILVALIITIHLIVSLHLAFLLGFRLMIQIVKQQNFETILEQLEAISSLATP